MSLSLEEICIKLQSNERRVKLGALEDLQMKCRNRQEFSDDNIMEIYDECYLHLLKCYSDKYESVRDQSVETVNEFMERLPPNDFHLLNIVSSLAERLGQQETVEESEEIRLSFVKQLNKQVERYIQTGNKCSIQGCVDDIVRILIKVLKDPYPAVQREACRCVTLLASSIDSHYFRNHSESLAKALYGMLNHKHSQARIAAVNALGYVALHIDAGEALSRLLMEVSPLLMDSMPLVRRECGELGIRLLLELRDRYSYFERLIPLVLCCLKDESPEVREYILPLWVKCGKQYYDENEAELSKQEIADLPPANYPVDIKRPTIGCRAIVQRSLRLLNLITRESSDWKENVRLHSLKLLYQFVLHAEAAMTAKFFEIYPDVARACRDNEHIVAQEACNLADLMGRLLNYDDWCEHGFDGLVKNAKEGYLKCFYYMYKSALKIKFDDHVRLMDLLVKPDFSQTLKSGFQMYILLMNETVLDKTENEAIYSADCSSDLCEKLDSLHRNCYTSTIKVMALSLESEQSNGEELQTKGNTILEAIAKRYNFTVDDLHEKYFANALKYVDSIDAHLDALSEPILLLYGLIKLGQFREPYIHIITEKMKTVFEHCADESKVKVFTAVSIAMLDWHKTLRKPLNRSSELLQEFVKEVIEAHLIWKAGANAEAMRSLATATLCAISQGAAEEARLVLPGLAKYMPSLLEDQSVSTRHYAIKCLCNFGSIPLEDMKPIAYGCLQRLDDASAGIRILAVSVIPKLEPVVEAKDEITESTNASRTAINHDVWLTFVKQSMDMLFLHYDNPEKRLQATIKETILEMSKRYPEIAKDSYERTMNLTYNNFNLKALEKELPFIE
ncbi:dynein axonemal assembly factor 5 [Musca domestica]|uniref:Dynein assembly factor 5, axonemal n=1 Tax=Musca domestica TaxID=7370 RepID=A0A1I8N911_MUSDO|nr:dynein axonemal assembly factor 5 [Musca domestica]XP_011292212.1 dynein axonemal assembly factor 5 [Musca domestica]